MPALMKTGPHRVVGAGTGASGPALPDDQVMKAWSGGDGVGALQAPRDLLRVLIIDDHHDAADSLSNLVKIWGHDPDVAYGGAGALVMASNEIPDVMLMDIGMAEPNGYQLALHFRGQSRYAETLLVAVTGWADAPHRRLWSAVFDHYLVKPVDPSDLEMLLRDRDRLVRSRTGGERATATIRSDVAVGAGRHLRRGAASQLRKTPDSFFRGSSTCYG
jgi:DNA-binding response OmpR family regulator